MTHPQEEEANPVTFTPSSLVDARGNVYASGEDDPEEAVPEEQDEYIGIGASVGPLGEFIATGVYNGTFREGPEDRDLPISDANPLPYWRVTAASASIVCHHIDDASAPSGKALQFTLTNPAQNDTFELEQIVPVSPRALIYTPLILVTAPADSAVNSSVWMQYLDAAGNTTGSETQKVSTSGTPDPGDVIGYAGVPADAAFLQIRIGVDVIGAGVPASDSLTIREVYNGPPALRDEVWTFGRSGLTGTGGTNIFATSSNPQGHLLNATSHYPVAGNPFFGYVEEINVRLDQVRTGGSVTFQLYNGGTFYGPVATIDGANEIQAWATQDPIDVTTWLNVNQEFWVRATGSSFTPTAAEAFVRVRVRVWSNRTDDGFVVG